MAEDPFGEGAIERSRVTPEGKQPTPAVQVFGVPKREESNETYKKAKGRQLLADGPFS
jgi:hypothetical protein